MYKLIEFSAINDLINFVGNTESILDCNSDDNNKFFGVSIEKSEYKLGIAYKNYSIPPEILILQAYDILFIGFGDNFVTINYNKKEILVQMLLPSIFFEFLIINSNSIAIICEIDVLFVDKTGNIFFERNFNEIITGYKKINDFEISLDFFDNTIEIITIK